MQFNQILVFDLSVTVNTAPSGFLLLTLSGMTNPQYMGLSSSFTIQFSLIQYMGVVCVGCLIAQLSSNLYAQSTTPGNIVTTMSSSSNNAVGQTTNVTFFLKLFAPIPVGGWLLILLPTCVTPFLPIYCNNVYGFSLVASSIPVCTYASNTINTTNFAYPYLVTEAVAIIELSLINAPDSRNMSFSFQTFDSSSRMIGNSSSQFITNASPLLLACNASRNNSQLQTPYTLTINLTLHVALAASSVLAVLLPASTYTLSQISCSSAGGALTCNKVIDINTKVLTVSLTPPCGSCAAGSVIVFFINNLINPAFINSVSQSVTVQTMSSYGVIESNTLQLQLLPMSLSLSNYARNGPANTGSFYTMNFNCSMPPYAVANGALLQLSFTSGDTYYNVLPSNGILSYQQSISVFDNNNNPLSNYVTYYNDLAPYSLQSIVITICNAGTCPSSINITGLRRGFTPLTTMMQNVTISTLAGDKMAENNFSALGYNPIMSVNSISMILSNSYTYSVSSYTINFLSSCIPIQSGLIIALSPYHSIAGGCFMATNSTQLGYGLTCTLLNSTTMSLSYTGDPTVMMIDYILYTLTITNVLNPPTVMPIQYQFTTYFNNIASQQFIKTYQIRNPFVLAVICTKDNNTYAQNALMTISIASGYPAFD